MRIQLLLSFVAVAAIAGCGKSHHGTGTDGGAPADMADVAPAPVATHVSAVGATCCMDSDGAATHVAYLLNAAPLIPTIKGQKLNQPIGTFGELHVAGSDGSDVVINATVPQGNYIISPDGKSVFWANFDPTTSLTTGTVSINRFDVATKTNTVLSPSGGPSQFAGELPDMTPVFLPVPFASSTFFSPSGKYFLLGVLTNMQQVAGDLWVLDADTGATVLMRGNGEYLDIQAVLADDTLLFEDTVGGTSTGGAQPTNPVQNLYWQPISTTSTATAITTRVANFATTADGSQLVILHVNGDIDVWDTTKHTLSATPIVSGAASFTLGSDSNGPIAWVGTDQSLHVTDTSGAKTLDLTASVAAAALSGTPVFSPDNTHLYFWTTYELQATRGTLMHVAVKSGSTPNHIADNVSGPDLRVTDSALVYLQNVDQPGQLGDVVTSNLDGSSPVALNMKANVGGLQLSNPLPKTWSAVHLSSSVVDTTNSPIVGTALTGALTLGASGVGTAPATETTIDPAVGASQYELSDDAHDVVFIAGVAWNGTAGNYVGALKILDIKNDMQYIGGAVGVSEISPVANRAFFANAPVAAMAGIYYIKY